MRRVLIGIFSVLISLTVAGDTYAVFADSVSAQDNKFYAASFDLQLSTTDADANGVAEPTLANWSNQAVNVWSTSQLWLPGETKKASVFLRNYGRVDAQSLQWGLSGRIYNGAQQLDLVINLSEAWYDRNANGALDDGEDILPALKTAYGTTGQKLTLRQLYDGMDVVHGGVQFELEPGSQVLPGVYTNNLIGGYSGTGKGLFLTWEFDHNAAVKYQDTWVEVDMVFTAS